MGKHLLAACVALSLLGGCATTNDSSEAQAKDDVFLTGSRLPQKTTGPSAVHRVGREDWEEGARGKQVNPQGR